MDFGKIVENLIGVVSTVSFVIIGAAFLIGYFFKSYILTHPALRKIVEYFGNVSVANPRTPTETTSEKQERTFVKART